MDKYLTEKYTNCYKIASKNVQKELSSSTKKLIRGNSIFIRKPFLMMSVLWLIMFLIIVLTVTFLRDKPLSQIIISTTTGLFLFFGIFISIYSSRKSVFISFTTRWCLISNQLISIWKSKGYSIEELKKANAIKICYLKQLNIFYGSTIAAFITYINLQKQFSEDPYYIKHKTQEFINTFCLSAYITPQQLMVYMFLLWLGIYVFYLKPRLSWHEQIEACLKEEY